MPDGRWNWNGCPKSVSNIESCLSGDFAKYKLTSAVWQNTRFQVPDFRITEFEFIWDLNGRFLHVVRDSAGAFVTYNWNAFWLVRVETSIQKDKMKIATPELADEMWNGPFTSTNYNTQDWPFLKSIPLRFISGDFDKTVYYNALKSGDPGYGFMGGNFANSDCKNQGFVTSLDNEFRITINPGAAFPSSTSWR